MFIFQSNSPNATGRVSRERSSRFEECSESSIRSVPAIRSRVPSALAKQKRNASLVPELRLELGMIEIAQKIDNYLQLQL